MSDDDSRIEHPSPIKLTSPDLASGLLKRPDAVSDGKLTYTVVASSNDGKYSAGVFEAAGGATDYDAFPHDEFCHFLSGEATLTSADGTVTQIRAGEALFVPRGWKGRWSTPGFVKMFSIYAPA